MIVTLLLSYIQFIDCIYISLDLYVITFLLDDCSWYVCGCFYKKWSPCLFELSSLEFIDWVFTFIDFYFVSFHVIFFCWYGIGCNYKKWLLCMILKWIISYIKFVDWFFTHFDLYVDSFHLNYISQYISCFFARSDIFVWLWNYYYLISSSLIGYLLT